LILNQAKDPTKRMVLAKAATGDTLAGQGSTDRAREKTFERPAGWLDALLVLQQAPGRSRSHTPRWWGR